jgi:hypothetical protein
MRTAESASSCSIYDLCPQKYKFKYVDKLPDPSGPAAEFGKKFHEAVYASWNDRAAVHSDLQIHAMLHALYKYPKVQELPALREITGKASEHCIDIPCRQGRLYGFIDMILEDNSLNDIKTSKSAFTAAKRDEQRQHLFYVYGALKMGWLEPNKFPYKFRYIVVTTAAAPLVQVLTFNVTEKALQEFEEDFGLRLTKIELSFDTGLFPHNPGAHCRFCPFKNVCPAHQLSYS